MDQVKVNIRDFGKPKVVPLGERCAETLPLDDVFLTHAFKDNPCNPNVTIHSILLTVIVDFFYQWPNVHYNE